jgi:hypothetical protein
MADCEIGGTGKIDRDRGIADMAGLAVGLPQSRLTQGGNSQSNVQQSVKRGRRKKVDEPV